jgi:hypothetical protein
MEIFFLYASVIFITGVLSYFPRNARDRGKYVCLESNLPPTKVFNNTILKIKRIREFESWLAG